MISNHFHGPAVIFPPRSQLPHERTDIPAVVGVSPPSIAQACASTQTLLAGVEAMMQIVSKASWLLIPAISLICATEDTTLDDDSMSVRIPLG